MKGTIPATTALVAILTSASVFAQERAVVPQAERDRAQAEAVQGPTENQRVRSVTEVARVPLAGEVPDVEGRALRAREIVLDPGAIIAVHRHDLRPGIAYVLEGEVWEHRAGGEPMLKRAGETATEQNGVVHWWENKSSKVARALVVDIVPDE